MSGSLTVTGEGQIKARPDIANVNLGVQTVNKSAKEAVAQNAALMLRVLDAMKQLEVNSEDIQTIGFNVVPLIDYSENSPTYGKIVEYRAENIVSVKVDVAHAGQVLDAGVAAGATVAGGIYYGLRDEAPLRKKALMAAVSAARRDAESVAKASGVSLKGASSFEVLYGGSPLVMRTLMRAEKAGSTPIEPGILTLSANVRVIYTY